MKPSQLGLPNLSLLQYPHLLPTHFSPAVLPNTHFFTDTYTQYAYILPVREGLECSVDVTGVANVDQTDKPYKV